MWKRLPVKFRDAAHYALHRINTNSALLLLFSWRHRITCRRLGPGSGIQLRIGESRKFEGWVSTNYQVFVKNFLDGRLPLVGVNSLRFVYLDNVIEHLAKSDAALMLTNLCAAMESGGVLRLTTPNLRALAERYVSNDIAALSEFADDMGKHGLVANDLPDMLRLTFCAFGHEKGYIYDFDSLKRLIESSGFAGVTLYPVGLSKHKELCNLESRVGKSDQWGQMSLEAVKP